MTRPDQGETEDLSGRSRVVVNVATSWVAQVLIVVTGFFLPRAIDEQLGQVVLGIWDFAWSITSYIGFAHVGVGSSLNRYIAKYRAEKRLDALRTAVSTTVAIQMCLALLVVVATAILVWLMPVFADRLGGQLRTAQQVLVFLGGSIAVQLLFDTSRGILTGCHRWDLFNGINAGGQVLGTILMIVVLYLGGSLVDIAIVYCGSLLVQGVARSVVAKRVCPAARFDAGTITVDFARQILAFGVKTITIGAAGPMAIYATYIAVVAVLGPGALAILARPVALVRHIFTFMTRFTFVLIPMAESVRTLEGSAKLRELALTSVTFGVALAVPPCALLAAFGHDIIDLWMGPDYVNRAVIHIVSFYGLAAGSQSAIVTLLIGLNRHGRPAFVSMVLSLAIVALWIFIGAQMDLFSLSYFAAALLAVGIVVQGLYLPVVACRAMSLTAVDYLNAVSRPSILVALGLSVALLSVEFVQPSTSVRMMAGAIYCFLVMWTYYHALVPAATKTRIWSLFSSEAH